MCVLDNCGYHPHLPPPALTDDSRRKFLQGLITLPLATVLYFPDLAAAQASKVQRTTATVNGIKINYGLALPKAHQKKSTIVLVHEWWGLNNQILSVTQELANIGYIALAIDLYDGKTTTDSATASSYMNAIDKTIATRTISTAITQARHLGNGKVGTVGWCFGGGWSLNGSLAQPVDATVIYYGLLAGHSTTELQKLKGAVLGNFADQDSWIDKQMVDDFAKQMQQASRKFTAHWYHADHGFANPTGARYDAPSAQLAWQRTLNFYKENL